MKEFLANVIRKHSCTISRHQSYRGKKNFLDQITRTKEEQFDILWDYRVELRRSSPRTTFILKLDDYPITMVKDRIF